MIYKAYLQEYIAKLSPADTFDLLNNIEELSIKGNYRLRFPLYIYICLYADINLLSGSFLDECKQIKLYIQNNELLPRNYQKIVDLYQNKYSSERISHI